MPQTATLGPQAEYFLVEGVRLAVYRQGQGQALVCLHAIGHDSGDYQALAQGLPPGYELIRLDWPGQGGSGPDTQPPSAARYAQLLSGLLAQLQVQQPLLIGNSIGGAAALLYAQQAPLKALVLCDSGGLVPVNALSRGFCRLMAAFFAAGSAGAGWYGRLFALYYRRLLLPSPAAQAQRERIIAAGYTLAPLLRQAWLGFARPEADLRQLAASLDIPIWCVWARSDRVVPLWLCRPAIRRLRQGRLSTFPGGHSPFLEQPKAFLAAFQDFLASLPTDARSRPRADAY